MSWFWNKIYPSSSSSGEGGGGQFYPPSGGDSPGEKVSNDSGIKLVLMSCIMQRSHYAWRCGWASDVCVCVSLSFMI